MNLNLKLLGFKARFTNVDAYMVAFLIIAWLCLVIGVTYVGFLLTHWAIFTLFAYNITGLQFIAGFVLLSIISSFFNKKE